MQDPDAKPRSRRRRTTDDRAPDTTQLSAAAEGAYGAVTLPRPPVRPAAEQARPKTEHESIATSPATGAAVDPSVASVASPLFRHLSVETAIYVAIILIAIATRFWDLDSRALHHDESLHAYYSWIYSTEGDYRHNPLLHGPFLYHANALVYLLLGDSDASSRYLPALFGVGLVALPYLLRGPKFLGRWGALATSALLLVSPSLLYYSRYIRHDIYTVFGTLLLFTCIVRYIDRPARRWLVTGACTTALLLTNHEIIIAILAIFGLYLYGALLWNRLRQWRQVRRDAANLLIAIHGAAVLIALALYLFIPSRYRDEILDIPWENPTRQQQVDYYQSLATNPLVIGFIALAAGFLVGLIAIFSAARDPDRAADGWLASVLGDASTGTIESGIRGAWADRVGVGIAAAAGFAIFVVLFTSLFTNLNGLATSTFATDGTVLYWLGQHDYRRGEQPWFYYMLMLPQYEFLAVLLGGVAAIAIPARAVGSGFGRWRPGANLFFRHFVVVWFVLILGALSYAGEKMPWLVTHITLPLTILAGILIGGLVDRAVATSASARLTRRHLGWAEVGLVSLLLIAGGTWLALAGRVTYGQFNGPDDRGEWHLALNSYSADHWWLLALPPALGLAFIGASYNARGPRRAGLSALIAIVVGLALLQVHAAWRLTYLEGDVPRDMMIYTQTSPDVTRVVGELELLSSEMTGGKDLEIWYDSGTSWPMQWYLRHFTKKNFFGTSLPGPPNDAPVLIVANQYRGGVEEHMTGYTAQEYVLRWWYPEDSTYRNFAIAPELDPGRSAWKNAADPHGIGDVIRSIVDSAGTQLTPEGQQRLYRLLIYRDLPAENGSFDFTVYIRNDLVPLFNGIRY